MGFLPKDYVGVHTRVEKFHDEHKDSMSINTDFEIHGEKIVSFKATVTTKKGVFTGSSFGEVGKEKAFEKLETVAVGRALAFAGYEVKEGIASRDEIEEFKKKTDKDGAYVGDSSQMELTEWIELFKQEKDINHLVTLWKDFSKWKWSEKQLKWATEEKEKAKARLNGSTYTPET